MSTSHIKRRQFLGLGAAGLAWAALSKPAFGQNSLRHLGHHPAKARSVIFCYMSGGVSHVDSFDPKPMLNNMHGKTMPVAIKKTQFDSNGKIFKSPWKADRYGDCGRLMTNLFPHINQCADDIAVVRSMTAKFSEHAQGNFFMHTGFPFLGHPSAGAWINYGLGSLNENLPGHIILKKKTKEPHGGVSIFSNGFLPATTQGSFFDLMSKTPVPDIKNARPLEEQRHALDFLKTLDSGFADRIARGEDVMSSVQNYETAFRMQTEVPLVTDISNEPEHIKNAYGLNDKDTVMANYGHQALMARKLVEEGVRFVELSCSNFKGDGQAANPWDQHGNIAHGHAEMARQVDQPIAALISDLKQRGLLDSTLIVFTGEFGRTPFSQGSNGRDHNPYGFSVWLAGGGIQGGSTYGATDELGYHAVEDVSTAYDLWATVLHQLGINHEKLTYRYSGRDMRLTDVHGHVWNDILS